LRVHAWRGPQGKSGLIGQFDKKDKTRINHIFFKKRHQSCVLVNQKFAA